MNRYQNNNLELVFNLRREGYCDRRRLYDCFILFCELLPGHNNSIRIAIKHNHKICLCFKWKPLILWISRLRLREMKVKVQKPELFSTQAIWIIVLPSWPKLLCTRPTSSHNYVTKFLFHALHETDETLHEMSCINYKSLKNKKQSSKF